MGALATWGAVAGGAKAGREHLVRQEAEEAKTKQRGLDEAREERLMKMREKYKTEAAKTEREFRTGEAESERGFRTGERAAGEEFKGSEAEKQRQFEAVQKDKELASKEKQAGLKGPGAKKKRWTSKTIKGGSSMTPEGGLVEEPDKISIVDEQSGRAYTQQGRRFIPQGTDPSSIRTAPRDATTDLMNDPDLADAYIEAYGYLPAEFFTGSN